MKDKHTASPQSGSYEPDCLPVSAYLIEHPKEKYLVDTGWAREMSPNSEFDKTVQIKSLAWIREQSLDPNCVESLANHDPDIQPHVIEL